MNNVKDSESTTAARARHWTWLRILAGGVVLFALIERVLYTTKSITYVPSLLLIGAFTAPLAFSAFIASRTRALSVSSTTLLICALWGGVIGSVIAGSLEYNAIKQLNISSLIGIGIIEELAKLVVPIYFLFRGKYTSITDGLMIGVATGAGFAALESMGYGLAALITSNGNITAAVETLIIRGLSSPAAHIAWTGLLSGALWQAKETQLPHRYRNLLLTFIVVVVLHALWDVSASPLVLLVIGIVSLVLLFMRAHRAQKLALHEP